MGFTMNATVILTGVNAILVIALLYVYIRNLRKMYSDFTLGLLLFAGLFLVQNVASLYFYVTQMPLYAAGLDIHVFVMTALQTVAFLVLNKITWK